MSCNCPDPECEHKYGGINSACTILAVDVLPQLISGGFIPPLGVSAAADVSNGLVSTAGQFVTLDGTQGASIVRAQHADGVCVLQHGVPTWIRAPLSVALTAADRTSFVSLRVGPRPVRLPQVTFREVSKRCRAVPAASSFTNASQGFAFQVGAAPVLITGTIATAASAITVVEIVDSGGGLTFGTPVTQALGGVTPTVSFQPNLFRAASYLVWIESGGIGNEECFLRVTQALGGA